MSKRKALFATLVVAFGASSSLAEAHNLQSTQKVHELYTPPPSAQGLPATTVGGLGAIMNAYQLWRDGATLQACFMGGTQNVRQFFVDTEREWERYANLHWDFGNGPSYRNCEAARPSHIRIAFEDVGDWSLVGTAAIQKNALGQASLNIGSAAAGDVALVNKESLRGTILHEVGHAFGLEHEHQSPNDPCIKQIRWNAVYADLGGPPNKWSKQKIDENLGPLTHLERLRLTTYDPTSIMHYTFPASWFSDPACAVAPNYALSAMDKREITLAYPKNPQDQKFYIAGTQDTPGLNSKAQAAVADLGVPRANQDTLQSEIKNLNQGLAAGLRAEASTATIQTGNVVTTGNIDQQPTGPCSSAVAGVGRSVTINPKNCGNNTNNSNNTNSNNTNSNNTNSPINSNNDNRRGIFGNQNNNGNGTVNNSFGDAPSPNR